MNIDGCSFLLGSTKKFHTNIIFRRLSLVSIYPLKNLSPDWNEVGIAFITFMVLYCFII